MYEKGRRGASARRSVGGSSKIGTAKTGEATRICKFLQPHGNGLRAVVKYLDNIPDEDIVVLNIPTRPPLLYGLDEDLKSGRKEVLR